MGCDLPMVILWVVYLLFQSTHPHGVRPSTSYSNPYEWYRFNPRTHMGCDSNAYAYLDGIQVSIHAPTWGATFVRQRYTSAFGVSIHAPTWGATIVRLKINLYF